MMACNTWTGVSWCLLFTQEGVSNRNVSQVCQLIISCPLLHSGFSLILLLAAAEALLGGVCEWFLEIIVEMYVPLR